MVRCSSLHLNGEAQGTALMIHPQYQRSPSSRMKAVSKPAHANESAAGRAHALRGRRAPRRRVEAASSDGRLHRLLAGTRGHYALTRTETRGRRFSAVDG